MKQAKQFSVKYEDGGEIIITVPPGAPEDPVAVMCSAQQIASMQGFGHTATVKFQRLVDWPHG